MVPAPPQPCAPASEEPLPPPVAGEVPPRVATFADLPVHPSPIPPIDPYDAPFPPDTAVLTRGGLPAPGRGTAAGIEWMAGQTGVSIADWERAITTTYPGRNLRVRNMSYTWSSVGNLAVDLECTSAVYPTDSWVNVPRVSVTYPGTSTYRVLNSSSSGTAHYADWDIGECSGTSTSTHYLRYTSTSNNPTEWRWVGDSPTECECTWSWYDGEKVMRGTTRHGLQTRRQRLSEIIRRRISPGIHVRHERQPVTSTVDPREARARDTLRRVVGEEGYRGFLVNGFISVRSRRTQRVYVIYPGHGMTKVFHHGKCLERLCVVLPGDFPPTDSLITRYLMILNNEDHFRSLANKSTFARPSRQEPGPTESLVEIASRLPARKKNQEAA